jgi:hypothetical protein
MPRYIFLPRYAVDDVFERKLYIRVPAYDMRALLSAFHELRELHTPHACLICLIEIMKEPPRGVYERRWLSD